MHSERNRDKLSGLTHPINTEKRGTIMEKCKFCGAEMEEEVKLCPACGKDNEEVEETPAETPVEEVAPEEKNDNE